MNLTELAAKLREAFEHPRARLLLVVGTLTGISALLTLAIFLQASTTDTAVQRERDGGSPQGFGPAAPLTSAASPAPPPAPTAPAKAAAAAISAKLVEKGAGRCAGSIEAEAASVMAGVAQSNTVSLWSTVEPRDRHAASVFVAQRYPPNQTAPYGVTGVIASPAPSGTCDVTIVQVAPSPLPCADVRETLLRQGKLLGEVVGLPLIQAGDNQTLLMPTPANGCILVGFRAKFGE